MPRVTVQSAEVYRTKRGQGDSAILVDAAGNTFVATREITGNDTDFYIRKISPAGVVMGEWEVQGANGYKIDGGDLGASGDHLLVATSAHDTPNPIPPDGRWSAMGLAHIPGVFVPFDNQAPEAGGPDAFTPTETEVEVDYPRIQTMIDLAKHWTKDQLAYVLANFIKPQIVAEVAARLSGDPGPIADLLYKRIRDGSYEQLVAWQENFGYRPDPTPVPGAPEAPEADQPTAPQAEPEAPKLVSMDEIRLMFADVPDEPTS